MKKRIFLCLFIALALACFAFFAACAPQPENAGEGGQNNEQEGEQGNQGEQGNEENEPTPQEMLEDFVAAVESDTQKYRLGLTVRFTAGEEETVFSNSVFCNGSLYASAVTADDFSYSQYAKIDGDYTYVYLEMEGSGEMEIEYRDETSPGILNAFNELTEGLFPGVGEPLWDVVKEGMSADEEGIAFSSGYFSEGAVTLGDGAAAINLVWLEEADASSAVQDSISLDAVMEELDTNEEVSVSEGAEAAFASVTDFDRAYARFDWALNENSAEISGTIGFSDMSGLTSAQMTAQLSGGEMMLTVGNLFEDAVIAEGDGRFCCVYRPPADVSGDYTVTPNSPEADVLSAFSILYFSRVQKEYFQLKDGTDNVLTLSDAGKAYYNYCESLEVTCGEGDVFTVNAAVDGSSAVMYVTSVSLTVSEVGEERAAVVFPAEVTAAHEEFHASQEQQ